MLEFLFTMGQAMSALLLLYGGYLGLTQAALPLKRKAPVLNPALEDELMLLRHIHNDA